MKVTLNANNHADWASNGKVIEDTQVVKVSEAADKSDRQDKHQGHN